MKCRRAREPKCANMYIGTCAPGPHLTSCACLKGRACLCRENAAVFSSCISCMASGHTHMCVCPLLNVCARVCMCVRVSDSTSALDLLNFSCTQASVYEQTHKNVGAQKQNLHSDVSVRQALSVFAKANTFSREGEMWPPAGTSTSFARRHAEQNMTGPRQTKSQRVLVCLLRGLHTCRATQKEAAAEVAPAPSLQ